MSGGTVYTVALEAAALAGLRVRVSPHVPLWLYGETANAVGLNPTGVKPLKVRILLKPPKSEHNPVPVL